jgi:hypothetical protein
MKSSKSSHVALALASFTAAVLVIVSPAKASTYDPCVQFSSTANPSGVWSYGYGSTIGGPMTLYSFMQGWEGEYVWLTSSSQSLFVGPVLVYNPTGSTLYSGDSTMPPNFIGTNPGDGFSALRFTAPAAGQYNISGAFYGADQSGTTTDVYVLMNGTSVFDRTVNGFGSSSGQPFNLNETLNSGDYLDFAVKYHTGGPGSADTVFTVQISPVPEPSTLTLVGLGAAALMMVRRRR